ncbi:hypothetical protein EAL2_c15380 [Peptoclostridium acidaminophilum DSM 3953]|uniref:Uncharacterized protein n=1 Tax=Peptoclostridium acidaminophilum DSM 3953 TaxID=1286171 RepID=W8TG73_PEPAC|nr:hypothetical protein EAL2_c15380 [Peptoclostridium acidaminophilum DSM 3953]
MFYKYIADKTLNTEYAMKFHEVFNKIVLLGSKGYINIVNCKIKTDMNNETRGILL